MLTGSRHAVLLTGPPDIGPYERVLYWPEAGFDEGILHKVARMALDNRQAVVNSRSSHTGPNGEPLDALACPLFLEERLIGVVAIEMTHRSQPLQRLVVQQVQLGAKWLESMLRTQKETARKQLVDLVYFMVAGLEHDSFAVVAREATNVLAERFACHRVSLGFMRYHRIRVQAMSNARRIDRKSNRVRAICDAMGECLDQGASVVYPASPDDSMQVTHFHAKLADDQQKAAICTVPLVKNGRAVGALLLERNAASPFDADTVVRCEQIGLMLGPVLEIRRREARALPIKVFESLQGGFAKLFGPSHLPLKMGVVLAALLVFCLSVVGTTFRISCDAALEAGVCQAVVAPQQGYIDRALVRAGDRVHTGELLATLDNHELRLEQRKWQSQGVQLNNAYRKALAELNRSEVAILKAKRIQAEAQLDLVKQQLARSELVAPFSGLVVKGDLSQSLGSPVERGEVLFEVAPVDQYRVVLNVDDRDMGLVAPGQCGQLKLSGIPDLAIAVTIDRLTPVSTTEAGRSFFRVEAIMESDSDLLRPGMQGIAKIEVGRAKLLWVWTRHLVDGLRLFLWRWVP
ncbi:hypothetical protein DSCO28_23790 [Desulfosarcina ovata subsp. sediminis]|uniref:GAF domain-containing protein n=2 Tax=Desulfosarcina ovata TaxID=83564 RepID=A0A5K7ZRJ2_9BACT|nr:hypothetical protein DSCO28_23790 [Desulfosarcina ovata subsp. sediminis]